MTTPILNKKIMRVASLYNIGPVSKIKALKGGIINRTYYLKDARGDEFVVQMLHKMFSKDVMRDIYNITQHLSQNGWNCPKLLLSNKNEPFCEIDGHLWRVFNYIKGNHFSKKFIYKNFYKDIGILLGSLHRDLNFLQYKPKHILKGFHNKDFYIKKALSINKKIYPNRLQDIFDFVITNMKKYAIFMSKRQQIIHGDPKIENLLFTKKHVPFVFVDYDSFMLGSIYIDIGDCLRSLLSFSQNHNNFRNIVLEFLEGYNSSDVKKEKISYKQAVSSVKYIAMELCLRFIIDSVEKSYFSWDDKKYSTQEEHNEERALEMWNFFKKLDEML